MKKDTVLKALQNGEFDGVNHTYKPYDGYSKHKSHQIKMNVIVSNIKVTRVTRGKFFYGKENNWYENEEIEMLSGSSALNFIEKRPFFSQVRTDLFDYYPNLS